MNRVSLLFHGVITGAIAATIALGSGCVADECDDCTLDDGAGGKADETHPTASTGTLTVVAPAGTAWSTVQAYKRDGNVFYTLTPGTAKSFATGTYCVRTWVDGDVNDADCTVQLQGLVATTYKLGSIAIVHGRNERVFGFDIAASPYNGKLAARQQPTAYAAGTFALHLGRTAGDLDVPFTVAQGAQTTIDVTSLPSMRAVRLLPSTARALPDASGPRMLPLCTFDTFQRCGELRADDRPILVPAAKTETWMGLRALDTYGTRISVANFPTTPGIVDVQLRRLDFNHVTVTTSATATQTVAGKVQLRMVSNGAGTPIDKVLLADQPTGYGIDVPPGVYAVRTTFTHPVDGSSQYIDETFDLH